MPDVHLSDLQGLRREIPDFDPKLEFEYSDRELILLAEKILLLDSKPSTEEPAWLTARQYLDRIKREIYPSSGVPDPSIVSGMYWRTHPNGRKVNSVDQRRRNAATFYR